MKPEPESGSDRSEENRREGKGVIPRSKEEERKEGLVLLAIAILFLANVVLYLCHHYGVMS